MINTLTLAQAVVLAGLYFTLFFGLCKLIAYFDDQSQRARAKTADVIKRLSSDLIATLDAKFRERLERGSQIGQIIVEGQFQELRDKDHSFLPEKEYRRVFSEMLPRFVRYTRATELARWYPSGLRWLWGFAVAELAGMFTLAGMAAYEAVTESQCGTIYQTCLVIQGAILVAGFLLYVFVTTRGQRLYAVDETEED